MTLPRIDGIPVPGFVEAENYISVNDADLITLITTLNSKIDTITTKIDTLDGVLDSIKDTSGIKKITDALPVGDNNIGNVDIASAIPAGNNNIGDVGINQTTDGTTNRVVAKISQTAGENLVQLSGSNVEQTPGSDIPTKGVLVGGKDAAGKFQPISSHAISNAILIAHNYSGAHLTDGSGNATLTSASQAGVTLSHKIYPYKFNGVSWDRERGNTSGILLASAARTATISTDDQINYNAKGVRVTLDVTAIADSPSIVLALEIKDEASGRYEKVMECPAVTAEGTHTYILYPGVGTAVDDVVVTRSYPLERTWRVTVTHANANSITYSVGYALIL